MTSRKFVKFAAVAIAFAAIVITASFYTASVRATPTNGFKATTLVQGTFGEFHAFNHSILPNSTAGDNDENLWMSLQKTEGPSDLYVQSNVWQPVSATGVVASTGWHTHPGHSLIIVTSGTLTEYDSECKPHVYSFVPGQAAPTLIDPGHGHVHIIRNEGSVIASTIAVQLVPFDPNKANRRIDVPAPATCPNIL